MAKTVFISHANQDKPRIVEIVTTLLNAGFSLFIDHPEKIQDIDIDLVDGQIIRSLWDIEDGQTAGYQDRLDAELRRADCVLGILSENITAENSVLLGEFDVARYERKLILCSIARPGFKLPSRLDAYNTNPFDMERHGDVIVERSLTLLVKQVRLLIDSRQRTAEPAESTPPARNAFRVLHDTAPLRMGRSTQVDLLSMQADESAAPALLFGPRNELPNRLPECLSQSTGTATDSASLGATVVISIEWPSNTGVNFERLYQRRFSKQVSGVREDMSCAEIATAIANKGHKHIVYSNLAHADGKYRSADVAAWANFWFKRWPDETAPAAQGGQAPKVMPLLNLVLKDAEPGWDQNEPNLPPGGAGAEEARLRKVHAELLGEVGKMLSLKEGAAFVTQPVRFGDFEDWVKALDDRVLGDRDREQLRQSGCDYFGTPPKAEGVPLERLYTFASGWLKHGTV